MEKQMKVKIKRLEYGFKPFDTELTPCGYTHANHMSLTTKTVIRTFTVHNPVRVYESEEMERFIDGNDCRISAFIDGNIKNFSKQERKLFLGINC